MNLPANTRDTEMLVGTLGQKDPLEEDMGLQSDVTERLSTHACKFMIFPLVNWVV